MTRKQTNDGVAEHHRLNGWDMYPPFFADHKEYRFPSYPSPRDVRYCTTEESKLKDIPDLKTQMKRLGIDEWRPSPGSPTTPQET